MLFYKVSVICRHAVFVLYANKHVTVSQKLLLERVYGAMLI